MAVNEAAAHETHENLSSQAHRIVSHMIHTRRLRGGEVIVEAKLAEALGISRTPLREALQRLEGEGLVVKAAHRSFMVRNVDLAEYLQSLKLREILEPEAVALAIGRIDLGRIRAAREEIDALVSAPVYDIEAHWRSDTSVHELYIAACGNTVMAQMIRSLRVTTRLFEIAQLADRLGPDSSEHVAILDALEAVDAKAARRAVQTHIRSLYRYALDLVA